MGYDKGYSLFGPNVAPSGLFLYNNPPMPVVTPDYWPKQPAKLVRHFDRPVEVRNPMPVQSNTQIADWARGWDADKLVDELNRAKTVEVIDQAHIDDLGQQIFRVAVAMQLKSPDLYLFPLRGSRQPGIQVGVINQIGEDRTVAFNYTQHADPARHPVIRDDLRRQLEVKITDGDQLTLAILDTAVGGHGSVNLAKRLAEVRAQHFPSMRCTVSFHLLHAKERRPQGEKLITQQSTREINFSVEYFPVENLIIEDWNDGIGLEVTGKGADLELKVLRQRGQVAVRDGDSVTILESEDVSTFMTQKMADAVNDAMLTDADLEFLRNVDDEPTSEAL